MAAAAAAAAGAAAVLVVATEAEPKEEIYGTRESKNPPTSDSLSSSVVVWLSPLLPSRPPSLPPFLFSGVCNESSKVMVW